MENNENLEIEQISENTEHTAEQTPKTYTQEEVDEIVGKKIARTKMKVEKDFRRKYGELEDVLKAGTGSDNVEEVTQTFKDFYKKKGINIPSRDEYSSKDIETLARFDADEIIQAGYDDIVEEVDRLASKGADNMTARERATFKLLAEHRHNVERGRQLSEIGVGEDVYASKDFADFAAKFNSNVSIKDVYSIYEQTQNKKTPKTIGSLKNSKSTDSKLKDFYTPEEAKRFTKQDYINNPELEKIVEKSMMRWGKK